MKRGLLILALLISQAYGQKVLVEQKGDDVIGRQLAYAVKEQLRKSSQYHVVDTAADFGAQLSLRSLDLYANTNSAGVVSAVSVVFFYTDRSGRPTFAHTIVVAHADQVEQMASTIVADFDSEMSGNSNFKVVDRK